jgi:hypothetical protein
MPNPTVRGAVLALTFASAVALGAAPDAELLAELKSARATSSVLRKKADSDLFARLLAQATKVGVDELGESLVSHAAGTCAADSSESRPQWCDEFVEADLRKNRKAWWAEKGEQLWSLRLSREHHAVGDYDFKAKRFALKFVPNWCDIGSFMCVSTQLDRVVAGAKLELVVGAFEQGEKRFTAQVMVPVDEAQARTIAGLRDTDVPSQRGSVGDLEVIFRVSAKTKRVNLRTLSAEGMALPFVFVAATPIALRVTSDDDVVVEYFF